MNTIYMTRMMTYGLYTKSTWSMNLWTTHTHVCIYTWTVPQTQPGDSSLADEGMTSDLFSMAFPKSHCRFIKQRNEHYNHHHPLMFSALPRKIYIGQIKPRPYCQLAPVTTYFTLFLLQLTADIISQSCTTALLLHSLSFPFTSVFNSPSWSLSHIAPHTHSQTKSVTDA